MKKLWKSLGAVLTAAVLTACGGGGGDGCGGSSGKSPLASCPTAVTTDTTGGGTTSTQNTVTVTLVNSAGVTISPPSLNGPQNATAVAVVKTSSGSPIPNEIVTFTGPGITFTPSTATQLTDASGVARVQVRATDPLSGGATSIKATTASNAAGSINVALGAATATLGSISLGSGTVGAYQTVQVSVPVTLSGTTTPAVQFPVAFSASCGAFDPVQANTDSSGVARSTYRNQTGTTACAGTVTITAQVGSSSTTAQVIASAPTPTNLQFVSATPERIYLAGSPGQSQSLVKFRLVDASNNPVAGQNIALSLTLFPTGTYLGSVVGTTTIQQSTDAAGEVLVSVNAGSQPGPVQLEATMVSNTAIHNVSNTLAVASGLPVQKAFSLSVSTFNIEALNEDGVETTLTLRIADRLGNPVPDGTTVNFIAEGGQVVASCNTSGASTNGTASCSVKLASQAPRPSNGRVTVLAWAQGEETFIDAGTPTNNVFDPGETFEDLGQPFLDSNEDGVYQAGSEVTVGTVPGSTACTGSTLSVPNTCNGAWGQALVRQTAVIVFSGNRPSVTWGTPIVSGNRCAIPFQMTDVNGNPMPAGTSLNVSNIAGGGPLGAAATFTGFGGEGSPVPNTSDRSRTFHSVVLTNCVTAAGLNFTLSVVTPKNVTTSIFYP